MEKPLLKVGLAVVILLVLWFILAATAKWLAIFALLGGGGYFLYKKFIKAEAKSGG